MLFTVRQPVASANLFAVSLSQRSCLLKNSYPLLAPSVCFGPLTSSTHSEVLTKGHSCLHLLSFKTHGVEFEFGSPTQQLG